MCEGRRRAKNFFLAWVQRRRYYAITGAALVVVVVVRFNQVRGTLGGAQQPPAGTVLDHTLEDQNERYEARFVTAGDQIHVNGRKIVERNLRGGIDGLPVRIVNSTNDGHRRYELTPLDQNSPDLASALDLFNRKYGHTHQEVVLRLTAPTT
ncbi:hypothetical protein ACFQ1S_23870 [Kibdelosporangium lantanae]|uniref:Uncharacterized protein n=1 Tax=Kibdelosporangium lantanae TaxID=1497396 RepID=A0ABW3MGP6_9PSEU